MVKQLATLLLVPVSLVTLCGCDANFDANFDEDGQKLAEQRALRIERAAKRLAVQREQAARQFRAEEGARIAVANGYLPERQTKPEAASKSEKTNQSGTSGTISEAAPVSPEVAASEN